MGKTINWGASETGVGEQNPRKNIFIVVFSFFFFMFIYLSLLINSLI